MVRLPNPKGDLGRTDGIGVKTRDPKKVESDARFKRNDIPEDRVCPECRGALQNRWDRLKFRPRRQIWICPACYDIELEDAKALETDGGPERPEIGPD